jgi:hypothetical protein
VQRLPKPWEPEASARQRYVPVAAAVAIVAALVYVLLPFTFAGVVECSGALFGSQADPATPVGTIVGNSDAACSDTGGRRQVNAGVVIVAALVLGVGGALLPSDKDTPPG